MEKYLTLPLAENLERLGENLSNLNQRFLSASNALEKVLAFSGSIPTGGGSVQAHKLVRLYARLGRQFDKLELEALVLFVRQTFLELPERRKIAALVNVARELRFISQRASKLILLGEMLREFSAPACLTRLEQLLHLTREMLGQAIGAFTWEDGEAALEIAGWKREIETRHEDMRRELVASLVSSSRNQEATLLTLLAATTVTRISEAAANICAATIFVESGVLPEPEDSSRDFVPGFLV